MKIMGLQIPTLVVAVVRSAETTWTGWAVLHPVLKVNISSVVEFQRWWVLKSKIFGQKSMVLKGNHCTYFEITGSTSFSKSAEIVRSKSIFYVNILYRRPFFVKNVIF